MTLSSLNVRNRRKTVLNFELSSLEQRRLFAIAAIKDAIGPFNVAPNASTQTVSLAGTFNRTGTIVSIPVSYGVGANRVNTALNLTLFDETPITRANFLKYITSGKYTGSIIHRSITDFVLQGGGYKTDGSDIGDFGSILNEFNLSPRDAVGKVNTRGTLSMAKLSGNPNSATSEFFINLNDNTGKDANGNKLSGTAGDNGLDFQNSGFTTFAKLFQSSLSVADAIEALPTGNASSENSAWTDLPIADYDNTKGLVSDNFVVFGEPTVDETPEQTFTYTVTSGNAGIVSASIDTNGNLVLDYGDTPGKTTITVTATDPSGDSTSTQIGVTVDFLAVSVNGQPVNNAQSSPIVVANRESGSATTQSTLVVTNNDDTSLTIESYSVPDGFQLTDTTPVVLAPGESKTYTLLFSATQDGTYFGSVKFNTSVTPFEVPILGSIGLNPGMLGITANGGDVTSGQSTPVNVGIASTVRGKTQTFVVTNTGEVAVSLNTATVGAGFTITKQLPAALAPGASAELIVSVDASTGPGVKTATLTIPNNGATDNFTIPLTATVARTVTLNSTINTLTFIDDGGSTTKYTYKGAGSVTFAVTGAAADPTTKGKAAIFDGTDILLSDVVFDGSTNATTSLTASIKGGDGASAIGSITATAALGALKLTGVTLTNLTGTSLSSLTASTINGTVTTGVTGGSIVVNAIANATLTLSNDIKAFTTSSITSSTLTLSGPDTVVVKGDIASSTLNVTGAPKTISAASLTNSTINTAAGVGNVAVKGAVNSSTLNLVGPVSTIKTGALTSSNVNIGFSNNAFLGTSSAKSVSFASISKSTLAVSAAGTINLGSFTSDAADLTTVRLKTAKSLTGTGTSKFSIKNIATGTDVSAAPTAAGLTDTRLKITVVA